MTLKVDAVYEDGVLKPDHALPLREHERVTVSVKPQVSRIRQSAGLIGFRGDPQVLRKMAIDPEFGLEESP